MQTNTAGVVLIIMSIEVTRLFTYPVKSGAGIEVQASVVGPRGLENDRDYMLIDPAGNYLSQRQIPEMALLIPEIGESALRLSYGSYSFDIPRELKPDNSAVVDGNVHGNPVKGQVVSAEAGEWLTEVLPRYKDGERLRLIKVRDDLQRFVLPKYRRPGASNMVGFADGFPILLVSEASFAELSTVIPEDERDIRRLRPNIVVAGENLEPYAEDYWREVSINGVAVYCVKACARCNVPNVNQQTAKITKSVTKALTKTRSGSDPTVDTPEGKRPQNGIFFGQNMTPRFSFGPQIVRVGDTLEVLTSSTERNVLLRNSKL